MAISPVDAIRLESQAESRGSQYALVLNLTTEVALLRRDVRLLMLSAIPAALVALVVAIIALVLVVQFIMFRPAGAFAPAPFIAPASAGPLLAPLASLDQRPGILFMEA